MALSSPCRRRSAMPTTGRTLLGRAGRAAVGDGGDARRRRCLPPALKYAPLWQRRGDDALLDSRATALARGRGAQRRWRRSNDAPGAPPCEHAADGRRRARRRRAAASSKCSSLASTTVRPRRDGPAETRWMARPPVNFKILTSQRPRRAGAAYARTAPVGARAACRSTSSASPPASSSRVAAAAADGGGKPSSRLGAASMRPTRATPAARATAAAHGGDERQPGARRPANVLATAGRGSGSQPSRDGAAPSLNGLGHSPNEIAR